MSKVTEHIGMRIRQCRKRKGFTIEEFSKKINKSKATLSKYENGSISIDIDTLYEIAKALEMDLSHLVHYQSPSARQLTNVKKGYFNQTQLYMYYYDGRKKKLIRSILCLSDSNDEKHSANAVLYHGVSDLSDKEQCENVYNGVLDNFDSTTHATLINQINKSERIHFILMNPIRIGMPAVGLMAGIANPPFFSPLAIKIIISKYLLEEDEAFDNIINISKEEFKRYRQLNMMIIDNNNYKALKTK